MYSSTNIEIVNEQRRWYTDRFLLKLFKQRPMWAMIYLDYKIDNIPVQLTFAVSWNGTWIYGGYSVLTLNMEFEDRLFYIFTNAKHDWTFYKILSHKWNQFQNWIFCLLHFLWFLCFFQILDAACNTWSDVTIQSLALFTLWKCLQCENNGLCFKISLLFNGSKCNKYFFLSGSEWEESQYIVIKI